MYIASSDCGGRTSGICMLACDVGISSVGEITPRCAYRGSWLLYFSLKTNMFIKCRGQIAILGTQRIALVCISL